jgi:hypothetical protein
VQKVKDFVKRPEDVIRAVRALRRLGLSVSLPYQTGSGEMFFEIDGHVLTVAQMLKLMDQNQLGSRGESVKSVPRKRDGGKRKVS